MGTSFLSEIAVSLGKNDIRIYHKVGGKWQQIHTLTEHLSRVLAIDWAPSTNCIVTASAVSWINQSLFEYSEFVFLSRIIMRMYGHGKVKMVLGNRKWSNYNELIELFVVRNGHPMVK